VLRDTAAAIKAKGSRSLAYYKLTPNAARVSQHWYSVVGFISHAQAGGKAFILLTTLEQVINKGATAIGRRCINALSCFKQSAKLGLASAQASSCVLSDEGKSV